MMILIHVPNQMKNFFQLQRNFKGKTRTSRPWKVNGVMKKTLNTSNF